MTSEKRFWVQIAATIVSPLIVAGVLWLGTFMGNTATKNDVKELRTEIKNDVKELRTEIKGDFDRVEKKIEEQTERIDRLLLHLVPQDKK